GALLLAHAPGRARASAGGGGRRRDGRRSAARRGRGRVRARCRRVREVDREAARTARARGAALEPRRACPLRRAAGPARRSDRHLARGGPQEPGRRRRQRAAVRPLPAEDRLPGRGGAPRRYLPAKWNVGDVGAVAMKHLAPQTLLLAGLGLASAAPAHGAQGDSVPEPAALLVDRREIIVPARGAEVVRIDNLLGRVGIRGTARPGEIHVVAEKRASSAEVL